MCSIYSFTTEPLQWLHSVSVCPSARTSAPWNKPVGITDISLHCQINMFRADQCIFHCRHPAGVDVWFSVCLWEQPVEHEIRCYAANRSEPWQGPLHSPPNPSPRGGGRSSHPHCRDLEGSRQHPETEEHCSTLHIFWVRFSPAMLISIYSSHSVHSF